MEDPAERFRAIDIEHRQALREKQRATAENLGLGPDAGPAEIQDALVRKK